jgi:flagellar biosynthesis/type III secretory pathway chaperone
VLTNRLPEEEATQVNKYGKKLRSVIERIVTVNSQNKILLDNSLRFIKHNIRIMTDGYTKKLIDTTM